MKQLHFSIKINAPREKVWDTLWNEHTYPEWTKSFSEGSIAKSDWNEGSKILFLNGKGDGMYSSIDKKVTGELMSFRHIGMVKNGEELPVDEATRKWSGSMENYELKEDNGCTELSVYFDATDDHVQYFKEAFPVALKSVKTLSEQ